MASLVGQTVKCLPAMLETRVRSLGQEDALEKEMATPSSILVLKNPMDRGAWWATVHGVTKSDMTEQPARAHTHTQHESRNTYLSIPTISCTYYYLSYKHIM